MNSSYDKFSRKMLIKGWSEEQRTNKDMIDVIKKIKCLIIPYGEQGKIPIRDSIAGKILTIIKEIL